MCDSWALTKSRQSLEAEITELVEVQRLRSTAPLMISISDLAKELGVSVRTLRREQAAGRMPPRIKRGRRQMYLKADIANWIKEKEQSK